MQHTEATHIAVLYNRVSRSHITRRLPQIHYSKEDLTKWLYKNNYKKMFKKWKRASFSRWLAPSLDRLDTRKGYELNNLELVTWRVNQDRAYRDRKAGVGRMADDNEPIVQLDANGNYDNEYVSVSEAARQTGINRGNISSSKDGRLKTAGGSKWVSKTSYEKTLVGTESDVAWDTW